VTADVLGQAVDHQAGPHRLRLKQVGGGHGVVHEVDQTELFAQRAYLSQGRDLGTGIGDGFHEHQPGFFPDRGPHCLRIRGIDEADVYSLGGEGVEQAVGVAEQKRGGDEMIARPQQCKQGGADRRHAGGKADALQPAFHGGDLVLQGVHRGIDLPAIGMARSGALKRGGQISGILVTVSHRGVHRFLQRTVLNRLLSIAVNDPRGETFHLRSSGSALAQAGAAALRAALSA
jgi:hypothetical protein